MCYEILMKINKLMKKICLFFLNFLFTPKNKKYENFDSVYLMNKNNG
jgi:hypothetical protein